ncbi:MAG TPA: transcription termination factor Rho [Rubricoccaceae bacterium]|jgi:transcription termination factor Rho
MTIASLERMSDDDLHDAARALGLVADAGTQRRDLIYEILEAQAAEASGPAGRTDVRRRPVRVRRPIAASWPAYMQDFDPARAVLEGLIRKVGVLELLPDGYGFLRSAEYSYLPSADDIYVSPSQIKRFSLRLGDTVDGQVRPPKEGERFFALLRVHSVNGRTPELFTERTGYDFLTPGYPDAPLRLEPGPGAEALPPDAALTARLVDLIAPIGKGQRGLIVAPPGAGRSTLVEHLALAIRAGHPEATLIVLLVDARPEDATAAERVLPDAEVVATTFDEPPERQVHVADLVLEKAKRLVEAGQDVVILLDSVTRLVRAHNSVARAEARPASTLDPAAARGPKRFFGAARAVEEGGSLTVLATILVETGSALDDAVFEEFAGTGNLEIRLRRDLAAAGLFPAIDVLASSTRRVEVLLSPERLAAVRSLRAGLIGLGPGAALAALTDRIRETPTNDDLLRTGE